MNNSSIDGNCGSNSETYATCLDSTFGDCCSEKGYCGRTAAYCGEGCQLGFGDCNNASEQTVSTTGSCGSTLTSNITCLGSTWGDCCSGQGYCGGNASYCTTGCQSEYGNCGLDSTASPSPSPTVSLTPTPTPSSASDGGLSKGAIAGISVGAAVGGIALIALLVWFLLFRKRARSTDEDTLINMAKPTMLHEIDSRVVQELESKHPHQAPAELPASH
ncbi:hypothetical protein BJX70DRAFT_380201 [Aspergillus crustosus]